ncbi:N-acetylmuramoyl-L-alanine amidase [Candidatus Dependentiae bacterium]|nr:N-acetylmuramoyl-L-alanine amidase [Candidatus Dependentiae bacterium]
MSLKQVGLFLFLSISQLHAFTVMIDPCGDAKCTGRVIQDTFERGITLQCAELLKKELNQLAPHIRVVLTRVPGETIQPLQNASFANRLQADLYIRISFYPEIDILPHVSFFQYVTQQTDFWHSYQPLCFYPVMQAHLIHISLTKKLGLLLNDFFKNSSFNNFFKVQGFFSIPYKPLCGIKAPALAIEAGIHQRDDYVYLIKPLVAFIREVAR